MTLRCCTYEWMLGLLELNFGLGFKEGIRAYRLESRVWRQSSRYISHNTYGKVSGVLGCIFCLALCTWAYQITNEHMFSRHGELGIIIWLLV